MNVLVTGAGGRIGQKLVAALIERGDQVRCLVMQQDPAARTLAALGPQVSVFRGNLEYYPEVEPAVAGAEAIVHLGAAMGSFTDYQFFEANVRGTFHVLQAARRVAPGLRRFVFPSSDAVYEKYVPGGLQSPINPDSSPRDGKGLYALTKILGEEMCWSYLRSYDIPGTVLRFPIARVASELPDFYELWLDGLLTYKRGQQRRDPEAARAVEILEGLQRQAGDVRHLVVARDEYGQPYQRVYVDVRDVVQAIMLALEQEAAVGQAFPIGGKDQPVSADRIVPYLSQKLKAPYFDVNLPGIPTCYAHDTRKTEVLLGYRPRYDVFAMIDEAVAARSTSEPGA
ncbi:MAG TPA: NAD(P)-dependent oxidoreductase [Chloroflexota bacterium]|nr:NAD(P)-dependent oxidoreductase [Chloroflexota bacterium]